MKKLRFNKKIVLGFASFLIIMQSYSDASCQVTKVWETTPLFMASESAVFDAKHNCIYVSNFNDQGGFIKQQDTLHNEFISKLDLDGNILDFKWIENLHNPTGLFIFKNKLYIVEREGLVIANLKKAKIEQRISVPEAKFLNDIAVDKDGIVYIADTFKPCIFRLKDGHSEIWYSDSLMNSSNGLLIDNGCLLVGNRGTENLLSISLNDKKKRVISTGLSDNIDGIKKFKNGYLLSWKSELYSYVNGNKTILLKLEDKNDFAADFDFIEEKNLIIVPLLISNKVIALKLDD